MLFRKARVRRGRSRSTSTFRAPGRDDAGLFAVVNQASNLQFVRNSPREAHGGDAGCLSAPEEREVVSISSVGPALHLREQT
jgi:hypothetical protein